IRARHPRLIALYVTGYGLTGPYADRGAFDRVASAFSGLTYVSGEADRPPVRSGYALLDYMGAYSGAFGVVTALYNRDHRGGSGQVIDLALYEPGFRASEDALVTYSATGKVRERRGNTNPKVVPAADFDTADGKRVSIHAGTQTLLRHAVMAALVAADIPASPLMSIADIAADPHFRERGTIVTAEDEEFGELL